MYSKLGDSDLNQGFPFVLNKLLARLLYKNNQQNIWIIFWNNKLIITTTVTSMETLSHDVLKKLQINFLKKKKSFWKAFEVRLFSVHYLCSFD